MNEDEIKFLRYLRLMMSPKKKIKESFFDDKMDASGNKYSTLINSLVQKGSLVVKHGYVFINER